jgi:hypothetical protein
MLVWFGYLRSSSLYCCYSRLRHHSMIRYFVQLREVVSNGDDRPGTLIQHSMYSRKRHMFRVLPSVATSLELSSFSLLIRHARVSSTSSGSPRLNFGIGSGKSFFMTDRADARRCRCFDFSSHLLGSWYRIGGISHRSLFVARREWESDLGDGVVGPHSLLSL